MPKRLKLKQKITSTDGYLMCRVEILPQMHGKFSRDNPHRQLVSWCKEHVQGSWAHTTTEKEIIVFSAERQRGIAHHFFGFKDEHDLLMFQLITKDISLYPMWSSRLLFTVIEQDE